MRSAHRGPLVYKGVAAILLVVGGWQFGAGVYIHAKAVAAQLLLRKAWAETRGGQECVRPWPWADTWPVARLMVARLGIDQIVLAGATGSSLAFGPGHMSATAQPGGDGNIVLAGHRDTHFRWLRRLRDGDEILVELPGGEARDYRVVRTSVVDYRAAELDLQPEWPRLTLVTCYPFDSPVPGGPLRYVVTAQAP